MANIVTKYAQLWPREVFDIKKGKRLVIEEIEELKKPGVYILYRDEVPYYIGKSRNRLSSRLHAHSNITTDRYFHFWNYFSFFVVDKDHVDEIEGLLIASMPTANSASPKIERVKLPKYVATVLRDVRREKVNVSSKSNKVLQSDKSQVSLSCSAPCNNN